MTKKLTVIVLTDRYLNIDHITSKLDSNVSKTIEHVSVFTDQEDETYQRIQAINNIETPYFMFVDNDDELLDGASSIISKMISDLDTTKYSIAYCDHVVNDTSADTPVKTVVSVGKYDEAKAMTNLGYLHHGVIVRTKDAKRLVNSLPNKGYHLQPVLYTALARTGTVYINGAFYQWNKKSTGLHTDSSIRERMLKAYSIIVKILNRPIASV